MHPDESSKAFELKFTLGRNNKFTLEVSGDLHLIEQAEPAEAAIKEILLLLKTKK